MKKTFSILILLALVCAAVFIPIRGTVMNKTYTNLIPLAVDKEGRVTGSVGNALLHSDGRISENDFYVSGFIPVRYGDVVRFQEPDLPKINETFTVALFKQDKEQSTGIGKNWKAISENEVFGSLTVEGNTITWDTSSIAYYHWGDDFAWLRLTHASPNAIVTINEPIPRSAVETPQKPDDAPVRLSADPLRGKTIVCFGDSLFGRDRGDDSAPAIIAERTGATVYNAGFGGCRMSVHPTFGYSAFSMWALAESIAENDWTEQEAQASSGSDSFPEQLALLKNIDFNDADIVIIHYGTNDFTAGGGVPIDNPADPYDCATLCGALRYSVEKLTDAYPHLQIHVSLPVYRFWTEDGAVQYAEDYVRHNRTLPDFNEALRKTAAEYNLPVIDGYNGMGVNRDNAAAYLSDGTHLNADGRRLFGEYIADCLTAR